MRILVKQPFTLGDGKIYRGAGLHEVTPDVAEVLDELVKCGWVVVLEDEPPPHLSTPEDGQRLILRRGLSPPALTPFI